MNNVNSETLLSCLETLVTSLENEEIWTWQSSVELFHLRQLEKLTSAGPSGDGTTSLRWRLQRLGIRESDERTDEHLVES